MTSRIIITMRRGIIQRMKCSQPNVEVRIVDLDAIDQEPADSAVRDRAEVLISEDEFEWDVNFH